MDSANITIIGAGVVGLAIAHELSKSFDGIVVLERHGSFGQETSSRNSEVIHSGIYYAQGSLKASLCLEGARLLYELCRKHSIPHKRLGKLIVAADRSEQPIIEGLMQKGAANGVENLRVLDAAGVKRLEPNVKAVSAIHSPDTGIVDSHSLMKHFLDSAESRGVLFVFGSGVAMIGREAEGYLVGVREEDYRYLSRVVINSAGLSSDAVAAMAGIDAKLSGYRLRYCKGSYFSYAGKSPVSMLTYPVPHEELAGLGVHATLDMGGRLRFGPDVEYIDEIDYKVAAEKRDVFYEGAAKMIDGLDKEAFISDMAGIRPKLSGPGEKSRDFVISHEAEKGLPGLINLIGIESPGLTASPAIAKKVAAMVGEILE